ncbi:MAG: hypothetical protein QGF59_11585 [Pirellulaceae bacterium]|nr:hypothetical protein [Pirellulaceae bacterium]
MIRSVTPAAPPRERRLARFTNATPYSTLLNTILLALQLPGVEMGPEARYVYACDRRLL